MRLITEPPTAKRKGGALEQNPASDASSCRSCLNRLALWLTALAVRAGRENMAACKRKPGVDMSPHVPKQKQIEYSISNAGVKPKEVKSCCFLCHGGLGDDTLCWRGLFVLRRARPASGKLLIFAANADSSI